MHRVRIKRLQPFVAFAPYCACAQVATNHANRFQRIVFPDRVTRLVTYYTDSAFPSQNFKYVLHVLFANLVNTHAGLHAFKRFHDKTVYS